MSEYLGSEKIVWLSNKLVLCFLVLQISKVLNKDIYCLVDVYIHC